MAKRALGRGLSALIGDTVTAGPADTTRPAGMLGDREAVMLPLEGLERSPHQPRQHLRQEGLEELARSIQGSGVLQPILVRRRPGGRHEIVAGERRVRAAQLAGLTEIPALICTLEDEEVLRVALLENIQREDLDPVEEAEAYQRMLRTYGATHAELAEMLGKKRSTITNMLRLLTLSASIQGLLAAGELTMGHARALLAIPGEAEREALARQVAREGLSVRSIEEKANTAAPGGGKQANKKSKSVSRRDRDGAVIREFETRLQERLGCPVRIRRRGERGRIEIAFFSNQELEGLLESIGVSAQI